MSDLSEFIQQATSERRKLLTIYLTCGYPHVEWTVPLAKSAFNAGADLIELGLPFSDPLADGLTIQRASTTALRNGFRLSDAFEAAQSLSEDGPILFMGYLNSILSGGADHFLRDCRNSGVKGLVIPDLPIDEERYVWQQFNTHNIPIIPFVSPTTSRARAGRIDSQDAPFIYAVSVAGVTGARRALAPETEDYLSRIKAQLKTPVLSGFGVSGPETAARLAAIVDGVIVGSAVP